MRKVAYYTLGAVFAIVPFVMYLYAIAMIANLNTFIEWKLAMTMPLGVALVVYYIWMFED